MQNKMKKMKKPNLETFPLANHFILKFHKTKGEKKNRAFWFKRKETELIKLERKLTNT